MERSMRIMILGEAGSGKTTLIKSFLDDNNTFTMRSNLHDDVYTGKCKHGKGHLDMQLTDVCSSGLDTCYIKLKMSSVDAFILMYSEDAEKTSDRLEFLKDEIIKAKYNDADVPVFVVRNRSDLPESVTWKKTDMANTVVWDWEKRLQRGVHDSRMADWKVVLECDRKNVSQFTISRSTSLRRGQMDWQRGLPKPSRDLQVCDELL